MVFMCALCYQDYRHWRSSEVSWSSLKVWQASFQQTQPDYLGKAISSNIVCFNSRESLLSGPNDAGPARVWCFLYYCR